MSGSKPGPLGYRHLAHAGNRADLGKHLLLLELFRQAIGPDGALQPGCYLESHAGPGGYRLPAGDQRWRYVVDLLDLCERDLGFGAYAPMLRAALASGVYPGSWQWLSAYFPPSSLEALLLWDVCFDGDGGQGRVRRFAGDGFAGVAQYLATRKSGTAMSDSGLAAGQRFLFIDPPYVPDKDGDRLKDVAAVELLLRKLPSMPVVVWFPLLSGFEGTAFCPGRSLLPPMSVCGLRWDDAERTGAMRGFGLSTGQLEWPSSAWLRALARALRAEWFCWP